MFVIHGESVVRDVINKTVVVCQSNNVIMMLNCPDSVNTGLVSNFHFNSKKLMSYSKRPEGGLLSASCHSIDELKKAEDIGVDFALISPVQLTKSHPEKKALGWPCVSDMLNEINIPIYALGGVSESDLRDSWNAGAQGVACMSSLWDKPRTV